MSRWKGNIFSIWLKIQIRTLNWSACTNNIFLAIHVGQLIANIFLNFIVIAICLPNTIFHSGEEDIVVFLIKLTEQIMVMVMVHCISDKFITVQCLESWLLDIDEVEIWKWWLITLVFSTAHLTIELQNAHNKGSNFHLAKQNILFVCCKLKYSIILCLI